MVNLDFICMGSSELLGMGRKQKIKNEKIWLPWDSNLRPARLDS